MNWVCVVVVILLCVGGVGHVVYCVYIGGCVYVLYDDYDMCVWCFFFKICECMTWNEHCVFVIWVDCGCCCCIVCSLVIHDMFIRMLCVCCMRFVCDVVVCVC